MREHTRIYQHIFSKTNSTTISSAGTMAAKAVAKAAVKWADLFGEKRAPVTLEIAEERLQLICPCHEPRTTTSGRGLSETNVSR